MTDQNTQQRKKDILKARADKLAARLDAPKTVGSAMEVLKFKLGTEICAVESHYVQEVYRLKDFTPLPTVPSFVYGLINVRRRILSVVDLHVLFDLPQQDDSKAKKAIILHYGEMEFAILADEILGVEAIEVDEIQPALPTLTGMQQEFLKGITASGLAILDGEKLLTDPRLIVDESIEV